MKLSKIISIFLVLVFILLMNGCSNSSTDTSPSSTAQSSVSSGSSSDISPSSTAQSTASALETTFIHIDFATDELVSKYSSVNEFIEFKDPGYQKILLTTDRKVTNLKFIEVEVSFTEENGFKYLEKSVLYTTNEFSPEKPFVVTWMEAGEFPHRGISYNENNIIKYYYIIEGGKDGSIPRLSLIEF